MFPAPRSSRPTAAGSGGGDGRGSGDADARVTQPGVPSNPSTVPDLLAVLQGQIRPHFLFNALTTIQSYVRDRPALAEDLIESLARYMQTVLTRRGPIFLAEELALIQLYLGLERARLGARLRTIFDVDPVALGLSLPALLVQPLVENAVVHAAARRSEGATLRLAVRYRRPRDRLLVVVADDGPGIVRTRSPWDDAGQQLDPGRPPVGLRNTRLRLEALYGGAGRLRLLRRPGGGTIAVLSVPTDPAALRSMGSGMLRGGLFPTAPWSGR